MRVTTGIALRTRIREIYAIDKLEGMSKTDEFTKAMRSAGKQKVDSVVALVRDPVGTIKRVPQGASRFFGRIGEGLERAASLRGGGKRVAKHHRRGKGESRPRGQIRSQSLLDQPGTSEQLTNIARAMAGGGLVLNAALMPIAEAVGSAITVLNVNQTLQATLVNSTPEDLRIMNRKKLLRARCHARECG